MSCTLERSADVLLEQRAVQSSQHERLEARAAAFAGQMRRAYLDVKEAAGEHDRRKTEVTELAGASAQLDKALELTAMRCHALASAMQAQRASHVALHRATQTSADGWAAVPALVAEKFVKHRLLAERREVVGAFAVCCQLVERGVLAVHGVASANGAARLGFPRLATLLGGWQQRLQVAVDERAAFLALLACGKADAAARVALCGAAAARTAVALDEAQQRAAVVEGHGAAFSSLADTFLRELGDTMAATIATRQAVRATAAQHLAEQLQALHVSAESRRAVVDAGVQLLATRHAAGVAATATTDAARANGEAELLAAQAAAHGTRQTLHAALLRSRAIYAQTRLLLPAVNAANAAVSALHTSAAALDAAEAAVRRKAAQARRFAVARHDLATLEADGRDAIDADAHEALLNTFAFLSALGNMVSKLVDTRGYTEGEERRGRSAIRAAMQSALAGLKQHPASGKRLRANDTQRAMPAPAARSSAKLTSSQLALHNSSSSSTKAAAGMMAPPDRHPQPPQPRRGASSESEWSIFGDRSHTATAAPPLPNPPRHMPPPTHANDGRSSSSSSRRRIRGDTSSLLAPSQATTRNGGAPSARPASRVGGAPMATPSPLPRRPTLVVTTNIPPAPSLLKQQHQTQRGAPRQFGKPVVPQKVLSQRALASNGEEDDLFENIFGPF